MLADGARTTLINNVITFKIVFRPTVTRRNSIFFHKIIFFKEQLKNVIIFDFSLT